MGTVRDFRFSKSGGEVPKPVAIIKGSTAVGSKSARMFSSQCDQLAGQGARGNLQRHALFSWGLAVADIRREIELQGSPSYRACHKLTGAFIYKRKHIALVRGSFHRNVTVTILYI